MPTAPNAIALRPARRVGVGAHDHPRGRVAPFHQLLEALELLGLLARLSSSMSPATISEGAVFT
jgi:hypothetical protein